MTKIKAPYNFVPLADKVVFPSWEKAVNHDVPFADGETGTINVRIKTHSPLFVRNGGKNKKGKPNDFFESNGKYYIPGSSLKGMLRSVMEILSFSKIQNANNDKYSVRDLSPGAKEIYLNKMKLKDIKCGWLYKKGDTYLLDDCGFPGRIYSSKITEELHSFFEKKNKYDKFTNNEGWDNNDDYQKSAKFKYDKWGGKIKTITSFSFSKDDNGRQIFVPGDDKRGTIVVSGQPGNNDCKEDRDGKIRCGKHYEFIFFKKTKTIELVGDNYNVVKNLFFAMYDNDPKKHSIDWKWRSKQFKEGERIPVFFRYENEKKQTVKDMGLSYLYKIIYNKSVLDSVPDNHKKEEKDFVDTLFGHIDKTQSLKGRVHVGHAVAVTNAKPLAPETSVLSGPKASYYPNYIRQNGKTGITQKYNTFMDDTAIIAGWKRYPVHNNGVVSNIGSTDNSKVETSFIPLDKGVEFEFKIRVHNVRKAELGAILSVITFHDTPRTYHSIGMAKPLGYGKSTLEISSLDGFSSNDKDIYLKEFEAYMNYALGYKLPKWDKSKQIIELLTMVSEHDNSGKSELAYMKMDTKGNNEFVEAKKAKEYLDDYSNLVGKKIVAKSFVLEADIADCYKNEKKVESKFHSVDLEQSKQKTIDNARKSVLNKVENDKSDLMALLNNSLDELNGYITAVGKEIKAKGVSGGLILDAIVSTDKKAFDKLKKEIEKYVQAKTGINNINKLIKENPQGILDSVFSDIVLSKSTDIVKGLKVKDQERKAKVYAKKVSEWLGQETAKLWFKEVNKSE